MTDETLEAVSDSPSTADLPMRQATKSEFVINLKAAKQIGTTLAETSLEDDY